MPATSRDRIGTAPVDAELAYTFVPVAACEMCGSGPDRHRVLGMRLNGTQGRDPKRASGIAVSVKRCSECGLVFADPRPVPARIADHYGAPAEDYWPPAYFDYDPAYFGAQIAVAKRLIGFKPGMHALDIGAGLGKCMRSLAHAGFEAHGIEPSEPFHRRAIGEMGADPARLALSTLEDARFDPAMFDFITFGAVLEHLQQPSAAIARALEWLKPGGIIQVEVPSSDHLVSRIIKAYYALRGTNFVTNISPMHAPFHLYEFTLRSFERNGARLGYTVAEHHYDVCEIMHLPRIAHPLLRWWMARTDTGMQLTVYLRKARASAPPGN
jgi:2-polyprenyl-3-methyl-5-hydroxy-6-metoxy-1,4-benzoquinol methylase